MRPADQAIGCLDAAASRVTLGRVVVIVASDLAETGGLGRPAFLVVCSIAEHITILGACSESEHRGRLMGAESRNVAARLRRLRQQRGWTAADLAEECHRIGAPSLTRSTIAKIESGVRKSVTAEEVAALARALSVEPSDLLREDGPGQADEVAPHGLIRRPRRRRAEKRSTNLETRFGARCPVCGAILAAAAPLDKATGRLAQIPGFRLEVGPPDSEGANPWRLTVVGANLPPATSTQPAFSEHEVDYAYLLCGGGHIFPESAPLFSVEGPSHAEPRHVDVWNMVAAIGAPASGKTYLLVRMLQQSLDNPSNWDSADADRIRLRQASPLEQIPLEFRSRMYAETITAGLAIPPTGIDTTGAPAGILATTLPEVLDAVRDVIGRVVVDGGQRSIGWGTAYRQPLVLWTDVRGRRRTWTGLADLSGEQFASDAPGRDTAQLRRYDALVWVIDPAVHASIDHLGDVLGDRYAEVLDGSLRPGTTAHVNANVVRGNRASIETAIGRRLTVVDGPFAAAEGGLPRLLVAVTKGDLLHAALHRRTLDELGDRDSVRRGTASYLIFLGRRWAEGKLITDAPTRNLLNYVYGGDEITPAVRQRRVAQVADTLLRHYSDPDAFWNLVHAGNADRVRIPSDADPETAAPEWIDVPGIGQYVDESLAAAGRWCLRDLVTSAVGCGIAYGLGHEEALYAVLRDPAQYPRFFVCSPLATVPASPDNEHLVPLAAAVRFPQPHARSAGLTQLLFAVLEKALHAEPAGTG